MASQVSWSLGTDEIRSAATLKAALAELVAVALFVFIGVGSIAAMLATATDLNGSIIIVAAAHGLMFGLLTASLAGISGGHINPAITFAFMLTGRISVTRGVIYIVFQMIGGVIGMLLLQAVLAKDVFNALPPAGGLSVSSLLAGKLAALGVETLGTFILVWTVFATAVNPKGQGNTAPIYIGFAVFALYLTLIPMTGAGLNPARAFGPALVQGDWHDHWIYWAGPLLGAALAGLGYSFLYLPEEE